MRTFVPILILGIALSACSTSSTKATPSPTSVASAPSPTTTSAAVQPTAKAAPTAVPVVASKPYKAFVASICQALTARNTQTLTNSLPYYQYNSGLRYGMLGDGEGSTSDPSLLGTWLQGRNVSCRFYSPDNAGHGTLLTSGWPQPGGWGIVEMDTFNGNWKINDFTFGTQNALYRAMQTSHPVLPYRG
jgi:hypothetical protein